MKVTEAVQRICCWLIRANISPISFKPDLVIWILPPKLIAVFPGVMFCWGVFVWSQLAHVWTRHFEVQLFAIEEEESAKRKAKIDWLARQSQLSRHPRRVGLYARLWNSAMNHAVVCCCIRKQQRKRSIRLSVDASKDRHLRERATDDNQSSSNGPITHFPLIRIVI